MARTFEVTRPGSNCIDCGQEMQEGETAVFLGRGKYAHNDACTPEQKQSAAAGNKAFWTTDATGPVADDSTTTVQPEPKVTIALNYGCKVTLTRRQWTMLIDGADWEDENYADFRRYIETELG